MSFFSSRFYATILLTMSVLTSTAQIDGIYTADDWKANLSSDGKTVTLDYSGNSRVKSVKLVKIHPITVGYDENGNPKRVLFSPGNLQYNANPEEGSPHWRFAPNQWDICFDQNKKYDVGENYSKWWTPGLYTKWNDLFGWGMWIDPSLTTDDVNPIKTSLDYDHDFIPSIGSGDLPKLTVMGEPWSLLSEPEWQFLVDAEGIRTKKHGFANVNDVNGVVLLPDDWGEYRPDIIVSIFQTWSPNVCDFYAANILRSPEAWKIMEDLGAVFLPACGYRRNNIYLDSRETVFVNVDYFDCGGYWTSHSYASSIAKEVSIFDGVFNIDRESRSSGMGVRLSCYLQPDVTIPDVIVEKLVDNQYYNIAINQDPSTRIWSFTLPDLTDYVVVPEYEDVEVEDINPQQYPFTGAEVKPGVTVTADGEVLATTEYKMDYKGDIINVGQKNVSVTVLNNAGGVLPAVEKTYEIVAKVITITAENKSKIFGNDDPAFTYTTDFAVADGVITVDFKRDPGENVGSYAITQDKIVINDPNYTFDFVDGQLTIEPYQINIVWGNTDFVYDGNEHVPEATVNCMLYDDKCTVTVTGAQIDAGTYTATATINNANYKLPGNGTTQFIIHKTDPDVTDPQAIDGIVFDNRLHTLITSGKTPHGTFKYKLGDGNYSDELPAAVAVGIYTIYYYVEGDKNHNSTQEKSLNAVIIPSDIPVVDADKMQCFVTAEHFCNGKARLVFLILAGSADTYSLTFNTDQIAPQSGTITENGVIEFDVPSNLALGKYTGNVVFSDSNGQSSESYTFDFQVSTIGDLIHQLYYNTLSANNSDYLYTSYQWRGNGVDLEGENHQYLHRQLSGYYTVLVTLASDGQQYESCPFYVDGVSISKKSSSGINVYPNPAKVGEQLTIEIVDFDPSSQYAIYINNDKGVIVKTIANAQQINTLWLPSGIYSGILLNNGVKTGFKIIVK